MPSIAPGSRTAFKQRRCEGSQIEIVLDDQYGTAL